MIIIFAPKFNFQDGRLKERIAFIRTLFQGNQRIRMSSESALMYVALRRKRMILLFPSVELLLLTRKQSMATDRVYQRPCRHLARNKTYREIVWNMYIHERFKKNFRISKDSFNFILSRIWNDLERQTIKKWRPNIPWMADVPSFQTIVWTIITLERKWLDWVFQLYARLWLRFVN